jgi:hypothetical protein
MVLLLWTLNGLAAAYRLLRTRWRSRKGERDRSRARSLPGQSPYGANAVSGEFNDPNILRPGICGTDMLYRLPEKEFAAVEKRIGAIISSRKGTDFTRPSFGVDPAAFKPGTPLDLVAEYMKQAIVDGDDSIDPITLRIQPSNIPNVPGRLAILVTWKMKGAPLYSPYNSTFKLHSFDDESAGVSLAETLEPGPEAR